MGVFVLLALFYCFVGAKTVYEVIRSWSRLWGPELEARDIALASRAAFFILIPPTVVLHELGHAVAIWGYGLQVVDWGFYGYMGYVVPSASAGSVGDFWISLAGNFVTFVIGIGSLSFGVLRPGRPARNILAIDLGRQSLFIVLVFYPLICIVFPGDWTRIYDFRTTPTHSAGVAVVHAIMLLYVYPRIWKKKWQPRAALLASRFAHVVVDAEKRVAQHPGDLTARRQLGLAYAEVGDTETAIRHLEPVRASGKADGHVLLALGLCLLDDGQAAEAAPVLGEAETRLFQPEAQSAARAGRICALVGADHPVEAIELAERDGLARLGPRAFEAWGRAMVMAGRSAQLRDTLSELTSQLGEPQRVIARRLEDELGR